MLKLTRLVLINSFGRQSARPIRSALLKLATAVAVASFSAYLAGHLINKLSLSAGLPPSWVILFIANCGFSLNALIILALAPRHNQNFQRLIGIWPLPPKYRLFTAYLPLFLIFGLLQIATSFPIWVLVHKLQLPFWIAWGTFGTFALSGAILASRLGVWLGLISLAANSLFSGLAFDRLLLTNNSLWLGPGYLSLVLGYGSIFYRPAIRLSFRSGKTRNFDWLNWFMAKIWRHASARGSIIFAISFNLVLAVAIPLKHLPTSVGLLNISALITAIMISDYRGLSRRHKSIEINLLRLKAFLTTELKAAVIWGILASLPLLALVLLHQAFWPAVWFYLVWQLTAVFVGLVVGSWLVAMPGESGSQFLAAAFSSALYFFVLKVAQPHVVAHIAIWLLVLVLLMFSTYLIESERRKSYGH